MTAVEFIVKQLDFLNRERKENLINAETYFKHKISLVQQAEEMEKKQKEKMYTEEDLREAFRQGEQNINYSEIYGLDSKLTEQEWFEKLKKK